ncbi:MAG: alginate lyase family protein, partial [Bacteroidales bacterium]
MKSAIIAMLSFVALSFGTTILAQSDYKMAGPYRVVARDGEFRSSKNGSEQDMKMAYECALAGDKEKALEIIHAYARTLERIDGHDAPLCTIQGYDLVRAMTLLREYKTEEWDKMLRTVWLAVLDKFEADSPYANGNWGAIVNRMRMAAAIYLEDSTLYAAALDYFYHANDNGSLPRYINELGQSQETGRDQAHVQLGLEALAQTCEMAREQGDDLWGALDNRLLKGFEYTAKYNLGYEVPFSTWTDCTGLYNDWTSPGAMSRGKLWDIYQLPYDHYVGRKGLKMPYTAMALEVLAGKRKIKIKDYQKLHQVFTYAAPRGAPLKQDYELYIQPRGSKEWTRIDTYMARVNAPVAEGKHRQSEISYAMFDFSG